MPVDPLIGRGRPKKKRKGAKTDARQIRRVQRARDILEMRLQGYSCDEIGQALKPKLSYQRVHQIISDELERAPKEATEKMLKIELRRLDRVQTVVDKLVLSEKQAEKPYVLPAVGRLLEIQARRASLLGLNAPTKIEQTGKDGGPQLHQVTTLDASKSFEAKALLALEKMRKAASAAEVEEDAT